MFQHNHNKNKDDELLKEICADLRDLKEIINNSNIEIGNMLEEFRIEQKVQDTKLKTHDDKLNNHEHRIINLESKVK